MAICDNCGSTDHWHCSPIESAATQRARLGFSPLTDEQRRENVADNLEAIAKIPTPDIQPALPRTKSQEDLSRRLGESLLWIDLRVKLATLLQHQADDGDARARDQLAFLGAGNWPGGAGPRAGEIVRLEQRCAALERLCTRLRDYVRAHDVQQGICDNEIADDVIVHEFEKLMGDWKS